MSILSCARYFRPWYFPTGYENKIIRLSIFLISGVCAGFPALLWALCVLHDYHKRGGRISFIAVFLLLSDLLELILNTVLIAYIFKEDYSACMVFETLLFGGTLCGHLLHQLVALQSILTQKYPSLAVVFSPACSIPLCIIVWLIAIGCQFIPNKNIFGMNICLCLLPVIVCIITCLVTCKAPSNTNQPMKSKPGVLVLNVSLFTLIFSYVPFVLTYILNLDFMLDCLSNMRLISEPLLCVLVCRENHLVQTKLHAASQ